MGSVLPKLLGRTTETLPSILAERAAHEIRHWSMIANATYALTVDNHGKLWMERPQSALLSETVGVYSANTTARELSQMIAEDLRFMLAEARSHGLKR